MPTDPLAPSKLRDLPELADLSRRCRDAGRAVVLCHGCFDIVHPGHLRYLRFAKDQGEVLVVSITCDDAIEKSDGTRPYVPQELRAESLAALEIVDHVVIAQSDTAAAVIRALAPDVYVKGKEYERSSHPGFLEEKRLVESLGGRVIHGSGEVVFSSTDLLASPGSAPGNAPGSSPGIAGGSGSENARAADLAGPDHRLSACCGRWGLDAPSLTRRLTTGMRGMEVVVIGDALVDRYAFCDASGVAGEAPVMCVRPAREVSYPGGAAIVAAHLQSLGARAHLVTTRGRGPDSSWLLEHLGRLGVQCTSFPTHEALPMKRRYLVGRQKLLKVDEVHPRPLDSRTQQDVLASLDALADHSDAAIFADFGCGTLTTPLVREAIALLRPRVGTIAGDVSGDRQTLLAYQGVDLLTPTERELRGVLGDFEQSLPTLASHLMRQLGVGRLAVTMGDRGCVLFHPREADRDNWFQARLRSEHIPALGGEAIDPLGAGDAFLAATTLALAAGASFPEAGYLGSLASGIAVHTMGNQPVTGDAMLAAMRQRPELAAPPLRYSA